MAQKEKCGFFRISQQDSCAKALNPVKLGSINFSTTAYPLSVINLALPFFGLILIGFFSGKLMRFKRSELGALNFFIVYITLPPMLYRLIAGAPFENLTNWPFILGTTLSTYLVFLTVFVIFTLSGQSSVSRAAVQASVASYGNVGYMGVPLMLAVFGEKAAVPATLILCFDSVLQFVLVPLLQVLGGHSKGGLGNTLLNILRKVLLHPFIIATALGFIASYFSYRPPQAIDKILTFLGLAAPACALFALGVTVALQPLRRVEWDLPVLTFVKLILHPILVLVVLLAMGGFPPMWVQVAVLMAALPTAANVFVMASHYESYEDGASSSILFNTMVSLATVTGLMVYMNAYGLPVSLSQLF